jgi:hypothetical protein
LRIGRIIDDSQNAKRAKLAKNTLLRKSIYDPLDTVSKPLHIEVDQQTELQFRLFQIREQLRTVNAFEALDGLDLNDDGLLNEEIETITAVKSPSAINERQRLFALYTQALVEQFEHQAGFVRRFQHTWADFLVHAQCRADDDIGESIEALSFVLGLSRANGRCKNWARPNSSKMLRVTYDRSMKE